jgi:hypothetical protein
MHSFLDWCSRTGAIVAIRESGFGMPAVQAVHLVGLTILLAAILVLHLRLAGAGMGEWSLPDIERQLRPCALAGLTLIVISGMVMFLANPTKYLASGPFLYKMSALSVAVVSQFGVLRRFFRTDPDVRPRALNLTVAVLSLTLWFSVGWAGRAIAFV